MKLPRDMSGEELVTLLCKYWLYQRAHQVGSHVICKYRNRGPIGLLFQHTKRYELAL
jgi:hypothetical protein